MNLMSFNYSAIFLVGPGLLADLRRQLVKPPGKKKKRRVRAVTRAPDAITSTSE
jgi:hypothetical protein